MRLDLRVLSLLRRFFRPSRAERGYVLMGCDLTGINAFFVRRDVAADHSPRTGTAACYEPPRYFLTREWGHPRRFVEERRGKRSTWPDGAPPGPPSPGAAPGHR